MKYFNVMLLLVLCTFFAAGNALAVTSGCITGQVRFIQANQGYCPSTRSCASDLYLQSHYKDPAGSPMRRVNLRLVKLSTTLGTAVTDDNGNFTMSWASLDNASHASLAVISRASAAGTEIFKIGAWNNSANDHKTFAVSSEFSITNGTCGSGSPQAPSTLAPFIIGSTTTPNDVANIYDAAERMWRWSVADSSSAAELPTIDIEYPADPGQCGTGCQIPGTKRIGIPNVNSDAFLGATRTAHEIGHLLAEKIYQSNTPNWCLDYSTFDSNTGWDLTTQEWTCASFPEAIATFMSDRSRYWSGHGAVADTCSFTELGSCSTLLDDNPTCSAGESRWPLSSIRFLWDAYDARVDGPNSETNQESFENLTAALSLFAAGTGERKRDEWTVTGGGNGSSNQRLDQSGTYDYWWLYGGPLLWPSAANNCEPPGDR
jgi:hypothetical protein